MKIHQITQNAMVASLYIVLTVVPPLNAISFYAIQFRISEALLVILLLRKDFLFGLLIGTFFANLLGPLGGGFALIDAVVGTLVTLAAASWMLVQKRFTLAMLAPIILNGLYLAFFLPFALELQVTPALWFTTFFTVALGEATVLFLLGWPLFQTLKRQKLFRNEKLGS
jgi:uncharacterized membrane protein